METNAKLSQRLSGRAPVLVILPIVVHGRSCKLYHNDGNWHFSDVTREAGLDDAGLYTHGAAVGDFDRDGYPDLFVAGYHGCRLYRNDRRGHFIDVTASSGIKCPDWNVTGCWADIDNDGWLDIVISNGHVWYESRESPYFQPAQLLRNEDGKRFVEVSDKGGPYFSIPHAGRGVAIGDLDNDGALDLVISRQNDPVVILRGRLPVGKSWVRVELRGAESNPDAIGAKISTRYRGRTLVRWVRGGGGFCPHFDPRVVFPAADDQPKDVSVRWPSGKTEVFAGLARGETHVLREGTGRKP